jgi:hypothetical protein
MRARLAVIASLAATLLILAVVAWLLVQSSGREAAQIRTRYQQMRAALTSQDTNAARALVAPNYRSGFDGYRFSMLNDFAQPLGPRSSILVLGNDAIVWPERTSHYVVLPGGHTIKMVRVDGNWFFTGRVSLD